jgi:hypothetical protein
MTQVLRLGLFHRKQTIKIHEAKFPINKIPINKMLRDENEKREFTLKKYSK